MGERVYALPVEECKAQCNKARELLEKEVLMSLFISDGMNYTCFKRLE